MSTSTADLIATLLVTINRSAVAFQVIEVSEPDVPLSKGPPTNSKQLPSAPIPGQESRVRGEDPGQAHACSSRRILGLASSREEAR
jgi:hypothetical protein